MARNGRERRKFVMEGRLVTASKSVFPNCPLDDIAPGMPATNSAENERLVRGEEIELPLVETLGSVRSHSASRISWHSHRVFELLFVLEGGTAYEFADRRSIELPGGHFLAVPPRTVHRGLHNVRMPATICGIVFNPDLKGACRQTPFTPADLAWVTAQFRQNALAVRPLGRELQRIIAGLGQQIRAFAQSPNDAVARTRLRLSTCAAILEAARQLTQVNRADSKQIADAVVAHMRTRLHEPLRVEELADHVGYGRARLFQLFKAATGMTPNDYLQRLRVKSARELLTTTAQPVTDIAQSLGFSTSQYFSNVFRKYTGATPTEYRAQPRPARARSSAK